MVGLRITRLDLGAMTGTTRESVNGAMRDLQKSGIAVRLSGDRGMALGTTLSRLQILLNVHLKDLEAQAQSLTFANSVVTYIQYECYWIREGGV